MRIAISNIAWDVSDDTHIAALLNQYGVDAIDVAPTKYFPDVQAARTEDIFAVRKWWSERGIAVIGMQSLLFGTSGFNLFGPEKEQQAMLEHLDHVCRIGANLGAQALVFGSPRNRDCSALAPEAAFDLAIRFFGQLGDIAERHGVTICLEPNPACYGANFMLNTADTVQIVRATGHLNIKMQLDTGAMAINGEESEEVISKYASLIGHIHLSEPNLVALGDAGVDHRTLARLTNLFLPGHVATIEMLPAKNEPNEVAIERALNVAIEHYRSPENMAAGDPE